MISYLSRGRVQNMRLKCVVRKLRGESSEEKREENLPKKKKKSYSSQVCQVYLKLLLSLILCMNDHICH